MITEAERMVSRVRTRTRTHRFDGENGRYHRETLKPPNATTQMNYALKQKEAEIIKE